MQRDQLHAYLSNTFQLEADLYHISELRKKYQSRANILCQKANITRDEIDYREKYKKSFFSIDKWMYGWLPEVDDFASFIFSIVPYTVGTVLDFSLFPITIIYNTSVRLKNKRNLSNANWTADEKLRTALAVDQKRLQSEQVQKDFLDAQISLLDEEYARISSELEELYSDDTLKPQYRNFIAVAKLYEYIDTEMTDTLTGPTGAYSKYENQLLAGMICASVTDLKKAVVAQLQDIKRNQYVIYQEIGRTNSLLASIDNHLYSIGQSLEESKRLLRSVVDHAVTANSYLESYSDKLQKISSGIDRAAINTSTDNLRSTLKEHEQRVNQYYSTY